MKTSPVGVLHTRSRAVVAVVALLFSLLVVAAAQTVRAALLANAHEWGTRLAESRAAEEESHLSTFGFILEYSSRDLDALLEQGADDATLLEWLDDLASLASEELGTGALLPYLIVDGRVIDTGSHATLHGLDPQNETWFQDALAASEGEGEGATTDPTSHVIVTDAYNDRVRSARVLTIATALSRPNSVLAIDIPTSSLNRMHTSIELPSDTSYFLFDGSGGLLSAVTEVDLDEPLTAEYVSRLYDSVVAGDLEGTADTYDGLDGRRRSIFYARTTNGWLSVITVPTQTILNGAWDPVVSATAGVCGVLVATIATVGIVYGARSVRVRRITNTLQILGNTFYAIYLVDHAHGTYVTIKAAPDTAQRIGRGGSYDHFHEVMRDFVEPKTYELFHESFSTESLHRLAIEGVTEFGGEYQRRMDGALHWVRLRAVFDPTLKGDEVIVCFRLVDAEVAQEKQAVELLESSLEAARQSARSKTTLFGSVSHDMRTPVNAIVGLTRLLREGDVSPERTAHYLELLEDAGEQLSQLVDDVLDLTHIEAIEQGALETRPVDLADVVARCVELYREQARQGEKNLRVHIDTEHPWVVADKRRIRQVLDNLISNALKYSLPGASVDVSLEDVAEPDASARKTRVRVYRITVADTGVGMPEDFLPKLFEPFAREEVFAPRGAKGTGLGMPIVKNLVQQMGGEIVVESALGRGTTFTMTIPFELASGPDKAAGEAGQSRPDEVVDTAPAGGLGAGRRVLLAEDNEANTLIMSALLGSLGAEVVTASNGWEAVERHADAGPFDAVLMDMQMPVMDGCEAARTIRETDARTPIIAVTANVFAEDIARAREAGMTDHVTKPVSLDALSRALARAWGDSAHQAPPEPTRPPKD